jgi:hypothetical protein
VGRGRQCTEYKPLLTSPKERNSAQPSLFGNQNCKLAFRSVDGGIEDDVEVQKSEFTIQHRSFSLGEGDGG